MSEPLIPPKDLLQRIAALEREMLKRDKVVEALKSRVKRSIQSSGNAFSTFENNILLSVQIAQQTARLHEATRLAQEANRAKTQFLAMMGQEIRTPMHAIVGLSQLALQGALDGPTRAYVAQLHQRRPRPCLPWWIAYGTTHASKRAEWSWSPPLSCCAKC